MVLFCRRRTRGGDDLPDFSARRMRVGADRQRAKMQHDGQLLSIQYYCLKLFFRLWWRSHRFMIVSKMTTPVPSTTSDDDDVERRFRNAGVVVPADRAEGAYAAARRLLANLH